MPVPKDQYGEFAQMWVDLVPSRIIAAKYSVSQSHVSYLRIKMGLEKRRIFTHGASAYANGMCRCDICTKANTTRQHLATLKRYADRPKDPLDPRHGTASFYVNHGCRCIPCRTAGSTNNKAVAQRRKEREAAPVVPYSSKLFLSEAATALPVA